MSRQTSVEHRVPLEERINPANPTGTSYRRGRPEVLPQQRSGRTGDRERPKIGWPRVAHPTSGAAWNEVGLHELGSPEFGDRRLDCGDDRLIEPHPAGR